MEHKQKGALIIGLGLVVLFGGILLVTRYFDDAVMSNGSTIKQPTSLEEVVSAPQKETAAQDALVLDWQIYMDDDYDFEFKYPERYFIESRLDESWKALIIKDGSGASIPVNVAKWKGQAIEEGAPGTFYAKLGYSSWKYFVDNFDLIKTGDCTEAIEINADPTGYKKSAVCLVTKTSNYIKVEMDSETVFYTKELEIRFELGQGGSKAVMDEMVASFKFSS